MALAAAIVWEVRPANGTANAGGGFKAGATGTDRSQQNAVQTAFTDLVIGNPTTTDLTSAASPFGATDVGNVIAITGGIGFTTGLYEVVSVAGTTATMDRAVGTAGSTGGTGNLGGARSGFSVGTTTLQASLVAGNKVWVKNEAWNEAVNLTVAGTAGAPITIEGYNATRGDLDFVPAQWANRPTNARAAAAGDGVTVGATSYILKYLTVTNAGTDGFESSSNRPIFIGCKATGCGGSGFNFNTGDTTNFIACESGSNSLGGIVGTTGRLQAEGCYCHDNTGAGFQMSSGILLLKLCISEANGGDGFGLTGNGTLTCINCTSDGNTGAATDGLSMGSGVNHSVVMNSIFSNNGNYGAGATATSGTWADYNDFFGNATGARSNFPTGPNDVTTDPTFTNRAAGNFSIGTNLKALGFPGLFPGGLSTGYLDIGAVQRQEPAGGGGGGASMRIIAGGGRS